MKIAINHKAKDSTVTFDYVKRFPGLYESVDHRGIYILSIDDQQFFINPGGGQLEMVIQSVWESRLFILISEDPTFNIEV